MINKIMNLDYLNKIVEVMVDGLFFESALRDKHPVRQKVWDVIWKFVPMERTWRLYLRSMR